MCESEIRLKSRMKRGCFVPKVKATGVKNVEWSSAHKGHLFIPMGSVYWSSAEQKALSQSVRHLR